MTSEPVINKLRPLRWGTVLLLGEHRRWLAMLRNAARSAGAAWRVEHQSHPPNVVAEATLPLVVVTRRTAAERLRWVAEQRTRAPIVALPLAADWPVAEHAAVEQAFREAGAVLVLWSPLDSQWVIELANRTFVQAWQTRQQTAPATEWIRDLLPW
jgi:hypothetical protein